MKKYLIIISILFSAMLFTTSCDNFLDVNTNPNRPAEVTPDLVLPVAENYTAGYLQNDRRLNMLGNMMMFNWSETFGFSWYDDEFRYKVTSTFYSRLFDQAYYNVLKQYADLDGVSAEYMDYKAIAAIMKVYHFQILVDLYGDVPYSEALKRGEIPTPKYDKAETIYKDLVVQLTNAIDLINTAEDDPTSIVPGDDDLIFGGDMLKWKQFANTLKIRIINRAKASFDVAKELTTIANEGSGYITENVVVNPPYVNEENKQNPFWADLGESVKGNVTLSNDATCATQYVLDYLQNSNDPRIDYIYEKPATGHLGVEQGVEASSDHDADHVSNIGSGILKSADMPAIIFSMAESNFNLAELALAGYSVGGTAESYYNSGVQASFDYLGAGDASAYLSQATPNINYAASAGNELEAIITQKWIAMNGITAEQSWFDFSRTGFPLNLPVSALAPSGKRPVRLFYPTSEITGNAGNMPTQADAFTGKIFWAN